MRIADVVDDPVFGTRRPGLDDIGDIVAGVEARMEADEARRAAADERSQEERRRQEFDRLADKNREEA
jgi:hypothetical protein